jgi:hypothetical protein
MRRIFLASVVLLSTLAAQPRFFPVADLKPDLEGVARTVFRGANSEEFPLRILGVLKNSGPGQDIILARLLTARLAHTGVMQGMSGSPVYIDGKLVGAIAFAFPFAKDPIAGIRPIGEMLNIESATPLRLARLHLGATTLEPEVPSPPTADAPVAVLTPISLGGFTAQTLAHFAPQWRRMGFALQQGATGNPSNAPASLPIRPGDMISVQLMRGDMSAGADGTVTHVDGNRIHAFGHRFLGAGAVEMPFAKSEVITSLANLNTSFKISQALGNAGAIVFDGDAAVRGEIGRAARMTPLRIRYRDGSGSREYNIDLVRHPLLTPMLLQMAIFSTLDHHFRSVGPGSVDIKGTLRYAGIPKPLVVGGRYVGDNNLPLAASLGAAIPMAFYEQHVEQSAQPEAIEFDLIARTDREQWVIESAFVSRRTARPGDTVTIRTVLSTADGREKVVEKPFPIPAWVGAGETLTLTVADSFTTNLLDFRSFYQPGGPVFRSAAHLIETINALHPGNAFYIRAYRASPGYQSGGGELGNLPPSIAAQLQKSPGTYLPLHQSKLLDLETLLAEGVVSGSKTLTLEIEK